MFLDIREVRQAQESLASGDIATARELAERIASRVQADARQQKLENRLADVETQVAAITHTDVKSTPEAELRVFLDAVVHVALATAISVAIASPLAWVLGDPILKDLAKASITAFLTQSAVEMERLARHGKEEPVLIPDGIAVVEEGVVDPREVNLTIKTYPVDPSRTDIWRKNLGYREELELPGPGD